MVPFASLSNGLARTLFDLARPILKWPPPAKKHVDAAEKQAAGQTRSGPGTRPAPAEPVLTRRAIAAAQIVRLESVPPLLWEKNAGFRCVAEDTIVTVKTADGAETTHTYPAKTLIAVTGGLVLFPADAAGEA